MKFLFYLLRRPIVRGGDWQSLHPSDLRAFMFKLYVFRDVDIRFLNN